METVRNASREDQANVSLTFHAVGYATLLAAALSVNSVIANPTFLLGVIAITALGHTVSILFRRAGSKFRLVEIVVFGVCLIAYIKMMMTPYQMAAFQAGTADSPQIKFAMMLVWMEMLRSFALTSDEAVLFTSIPSIATFGLVATENVNPDLLAYFLIYLLGSSLMLSMYSALHLRKSATWSGMSFPLSNLFRGAIVVTLVSFCVGTLLAWPVRLAIGQTSVYRPPGLPVGNLRVPGQFRNSSSTLFVMQGPIRLSDTEALTVRSDRPYYWRGNVYADYTGQRWEINPSAVQFDPPKDARIVQQIVTVQSAFPVVLYGAAEPVEIVERTKGAGDNGKLEPSSDWTWRTSRLQPVGFSYKVTSRVAEPGMSELKSAGTDYPKDISGLYLQTTSLTQNNPVRQLAEKVTEGCRTPYEKAQAIERYLTGNYTYDLNAPRVPPGQDAVEYFLFDSKRGYCDAFASSMAIMLRQLGIPSRIATGFATGEYDTSEKLYRVREKDRHAWVEVYFPKYGWITFDPSGAEEERKVEFWTVAGREIRLTFHRILADRSVMIVALILLMSLVFLARTDITFKGFRPRARQPVDPGLRKTLSLYNGMCRIAARKSAARTPDQTPSEYAEAVSAWPIVSADEAQLVEEITGLFEDVKYGGVAVDHATLDRMKMKVRELKAEARRSRRRR